MRRLLTNLTPPSISTPHCQSHPHSNTLKVLLSLCGASLYTLEKSQRNYNGHLRKLLEKTIQVASEILTPLLSKWHQKFSGYKIPTSPSKVGILGMALYTRSYIHNGSASPLTVGPVSKPQLIQFQFYEFSPIMGTRGRFDDLRGCCRSQLSRMFQT